MLPVLLVILTKMMLVLPVLVFPVLQMKAEVLVIVRRLGFMAIKKELK